MDKDLQKLGNKLNPPEHGSLVQFEGPIRWKCYRNIRCEGRINGTGLGSKAFVVLTKIGQYHVIRPARIALWVLKKDLLVIG